MQGSKKTKAASIWISEERSVLNQYKAAYCAALIPNICTGIFKQKILPDIFNYWASIDHPRLSEEQSQSIMQVS